MAHLIEENGLLFMTDRTHEEYVETERLQRKPYKTFTAEEKQAWLSGLHGAANRSDMERLSANLIAVSGEYGATFTPLQDFKSGAPSARGILVDGALDGNGGLWTGAEELEVLMEEFIPKQHSSRAWALLNWAESVCRTAHAKIVSLLIPHYASQTPEVYAGDGLGVL